MLGNLEELQKAGKMQMDTMNQSAMLFLNGAQRLTAEAMEQTRANLDHCATYLGRMTSAKSPDEAFRIQAEFAMASLERMMNSATSMADRCATVAKETTANAQDAADAAADVAERAAQTVQATYARAAAR